jgi:hypothetical protein
VATESPRSKPVNTSGVDKITVRAIGRRVRIVGESSVATLAADGPHVLRRNGSVLEVSSDGELGASLDGFSILKAPRNLDEFRSLGLGKELFLRVNPDIEVDVEVTGGSLNTERVPHLGKVRLTAGAAKLLDVEQIKDALIQAGQATVKGTITRGRSRIRAESGSLSIQLGAATIRSRGACWLRMNAAACARSASGTTLARMRACAESPRMGSSASRARSGKHISSWRSNSAALAAPKRPRVKSSMCGSSSVACSRTRVCMPGSRLKAALACPRHSHGTSTPYIACKSQIARSNSRTR